jgi:hypothetical protein
MTNCAALCMLAKSLISFRSYRSAHIVQSVNDTAWVFIAEGPGLPVAAIQHRGRLMSVQQKHLDLPIGLFLIKYESAEDSQNPPKVTFSLDPSSSSEVEFVLPPGVREPVLWSPGASLIARIEEKARLVVELASRGPNGSLAARIQSIPLSVDPMGVAAADQFAEEVDFSDIQILGHIAGRGDTLVPSGEWLGGPMAPSRIEGVSVEWPNRPRNFNFAYAVRVGGPSPTTTELSPAGSFAGSRGRALPLVGAIFEISGPAVTGYQITADAIFLGSPQMRVSGQRVVLSGPTGREPLVGLRLQIASIEAQNVRRVTAPAAPAPIPAPVVTAKKAGSGRVRVFRSKRAAGTE